MKVSKRMLLMSDDGKVCGWCGCDPCEESCAWMLQDRCEELEAEVKALREAAQDKLDTETDCWAANSDSVLYAAQTRNVKAHDALAALLQDGENETEKG